MESEELRTLTASERLTLEQEYEMQKKWREDEDKCTFIILSKQLFEETQNELESMIGDVNIFFTPEGSELEVMIAEPRFRGCGIGKEAICLMIRYSDEVLKRRNFHACLSKEAEEANVVPPRRPCCVFGPADSWGISPFAANPYSLVRARVPCVVYMYVYKQCGNRLITNGVH
uniref:N-acetyltransferase domain-containing protein n=1 Tax=Acrobeloides nanus TaxID=290746 RepID=A0A914DE62_9BILA